MKQVVVRKNGQMSFEEVGVKKLEKGKIRVRVSYAGVGFADVMAVRGGYVLAPQKPFSPGYEFAGTIEDSGGQASFPNGLRVAGVLPTMNAYREFLDLDPRWAVLVPDGLDLEKAALMPLNYLTASALIELKAKLQRGQSFLIHGAAGGVGSAALELSRKLGLRAFGTASPNKRADVEAQGGSFISSGNDWLKDALELQNSGFDAVFDSFGGTLLRESFRSLKRGGTLVSYGFAPTPDGGKGPMIDGIFFHLVKKIVSGGKKARICGTPSLIKNHLSWYRTTLTEHFERAQKGELNPKHHSTFPWDQAEQAHDLIEQRKVKGKILLKF